MNALAQIIPAADRVVTSQDNEAPEIVPASLAAAEDLPAIVRADIDAVTANALTSLETYSRVPAAIEDDTVYERVVTLSTQIKGVSDDLEKRRTEHKAPYLSGCRVIDDLFKLMHKAPDAPQGSQPRPLKKELEDAHKSLKQRLSAYDTKKYQAEQERIAQSQAAIAAAAAADGIELGEFAGEVKGPGTLKSSHGGSAVRKINKVWEVVDLNEVPRWLMMPDPAAIKALIDDGAKSIPGLKISEVVETHTQRQAR